MARKRAPAKKKAAAPIVIEAALSPANAGDQCEQLTAAFAEAQAAEQPLSIGLDGEDASPCALQLLIAADRSARKHNVTIDFSAEAKSALAGINLD